VTVVRNEALLAQNYRKLFGSRVGLKSLDPEWQGKRKQKNVENSKGGNKRTKRQKGGVGDQKWEDRPMLVFCRLKAEIYARNTRTDKTDARTDGQSKHVYNAAYVTAAQ